MPQRPPELEGCSPIEPEFSIPIPQADIGAGEQNIGSPNGLIRKFVVVSMLICLVYLVVGFGIWRHVNDVVGMSRDLVNEVEPLDQAAAEIEINVLEAILSIIKYMNDPDPSLLRRFEDDLDDLRSTISAFMATANDSKILDLGSRIQSDVTSLSKIGTHLVNLTDQRVSLGNKIRASLSEFKLIETHDDIGHITQGEAEGNSKPSPEEGRVSHRAFDDILWALSSYGSFNASTLTWGASSELQKSLSWVLEKNAIAPVSGHEDRLIQAIANDVLQFQQVSDERALLFKRLRSLRDKFDKVIDDRVQMLTAKKKREIFKNIVNDVEFAETSVAVIGVIMLVGVVLLGHVLWMRVIRPIEVLTNTTMAFGSGQYDVRVKRTFPDEIGLLAGSFNSMAERIQVAQGFFEQANTELKAIVEERTRQLAHSNDSLKAELSERKKAESKLKDAMEIAEAASAAKTAFLQHLSHELRTPLNGIVATAEMISNEVLGPLGSQKYKEYIHDVMTCGVHLQTHLEKIFTAANLELGKGEIRFCELDATRMLSDIVNGSSVIDAASSKGITVSLINEANLPGVWGSSEYLRQILENILDNAVKYTGDGGEICIRTRQQGATHVVVEVIDTGIGMTDAEIDEAFEFFNTSNPMHAEGRRGLGLGLSISNRLAQLQGSSLKIQSRPEEGTTVQLKMRSVSDRAIIHTA